MKLSQRNGTKRKATSTKRNSKFSTIDEYISMYPENIQKILEKVRRTIKDTAPGAEEAISYQMPAFKLNRVLVWFAAFKDHIAFFATMSPMEVFQKELAPYKSGKATIRFPLDKPIPYDLVRKIVKFRVKENLNKK
jgi:uncharacterized protein YdhG (YjbR/CyaY superfamily)